MIFKIFYFKLELNMSINYQKIFLQDYSYKSIN